MVSFSQHICDHCSFLAEQGYKNHSKKNVGSSCIQWKSNCSDLSCMCICGTDRRNFQCNRFGNYSFFLYCEYGRKQSDAAMCSGGCCIPDSWNGNADGCMLSSSRCISCTGDDRIRSTSDCSTYVCILFWYYFSNYAAGCNRGIRRGRNCKVQPNEGWNYIMYSCTSGILYPVCICV